MIQIGISTFVETTPDPQGYVISHAQRIRQAIAEVELADKVGLDVYAIGEHHRPDFAVSQPTEVLAAASVNTKNIRLSSAVTVLNTADPVRVFQGFSTVDALSNGRAEIMVGRGSFTESYPLFGYSLAQYDQLREEKLDLLLKIVNNNKEVHWNGTVRSPLTGQGVYPNPVQGKIPVWIGTGGSPDSVIRAGVLGLPIAFAIIGGNPVGFKPFVDLYKRTLAQYNNFDEVEKIVGSHFIAQHSHGFVAETDEIAQEKYFHSTYTLMHQLGIERNWPPYTRLSYDAACSENGALFVGSPETVATKIIKMRKEVGIRRFLLHVPVGTMENHDDVLKAIELLGTKVVPLVKEEIKGFED